MGGEHDHLADNIKALRETRGLSQQQMAKAAGIPRATWTHLESGAANPTLTVLIKVANALQVSRDQTDTYPVMQGDRAQLQQIQREIQQHEQALKRARQAGNREAVQQEQNEIKRLRERAEQIQREIRQLQSGRGGR